MKLTPQQRFLIILFMINDFDNYPNESMYSTQFGMCYWILFNIDSVLIDNLDVMFGFNRPSSSEWFSLYWFKKGDGKSRVKFLNDELDKLIHEYGEELFS